MKITMLIIAAIAILVLPTGADAGPGKPGGYMSGFIGVNQARDATLTTTNYLSAPTTEYSDLLEFDPNIFIGGTGGYDFGILRLEGELSYRHAEIDAIHEIHPISPPARSYRSIDGSLGVTALMANAFIDIENPSLVTPYFGGGIGVAGLHLRDTSGRPTTGGSRVDLYSDDDATVAAFQAGAGLEVSINPHFSIDLGYRYFRTNEALFDSADTDIERRMRFESHSFALGFRAKF